MISVLEACEVVSKTFYTPYVGTVLDVGNGYVVSWLEKNGFAPLGWPLFVDKQTGESRAYIIPDHFDEIKRAKRIPVPKQYRYPGKIRSISDLVGK